MRRALFFIIILMAKHGIGSSSKRKSHETGTPCPICDGTFKVTDHYVSFRQQASDDSKVYRGRKTDLPRHMANIHGLKSSSAYALHAEAVSLENQPSCFLYA
jgi:hypothetical protein